MDIHRCILKLIPDAKFIIWENDYSRLDWNSSNLFPKPTFDELVTIWPQVQIDIIAEKEKEAAAKAKKEDILAVVAGKTVDQLSQKEKDSLLVVLLMQLGFANENGKMILL